MHARSGLFVTQTAQATHSGSHVPDVYNRDELSKNEPGTVAALTLRLRSHADLEAWHGLEWTAKGA